MEIGCGICRLKIAQTGELRPIQVNLTSPFVEAAIQVSVDDQGSGSDLFGRLCQGRDDPAPLAC